VLRRSDGALGAGAAITIVRAFDGKPPARYLTVTTSSAGAWSATFAPPFNATYTAVFAGTGSVAPATSPKARTTVAPRISVSSPLNRSTSSSSLPLKVKGHVAPNKAGKVVTLYYVNSRGRLIKLASTKLSSKSTYLFSVALKRGTWHLRVLIAATTGNTSGRSANVTVKRT
jgi:hypothetical protein